MSGFAGPAQQAADAVDGELDGQIRGPLSGPPQDAMRVKFGSIVCRDAVALFADYVEIFDLGVDRLNERWHRGVARDFFVGDDVADREQAIADARGAEAAALRAEYGKLEHALDTGAANIATALNLSPAYASTKFEQYRAAMVPVLANAHAKGPELVALGDSYSAGTGTGTYYTDGADNPFRSTQAYSWVLAARYGLRVNHQATNGATTEDIIRTQLGALSHDTRYVTLTAGGNDLGFSTVVESALASDATDQIEAKREQIRNGEFERKLDALYGQIKERAPNASVVVGTYPHLFDGEAGAPDNVLLSDDEERALVAANDEMAAVIERMAAKHGFQVADARDAYEGHSSEALGRRWLNPVVLRPDQEGEILDGWVDADSFHPNTDGHHAYADAFDEYFRR